MVTCTCHSPEETLQLGEAWGRTAASGWLIGLQGELGSGKTQLVKGLARGLGFAGRVHSPTFTLLNLYEGGRHPLHHLDLYRLSGPEAVFQAGLEEYLWDPPGVVVVEWIERWLGPPPWDAALLPRGAGGFRHVILETVGETGRRIAYEDLGA